MAGFVDDLRRLRGATSLQEIGSRMGYHSSTVSRRLNPDEPPSLDFVRAYVTACGADPGLWEERWRELMEPSAGSADGLAYRPPAVRPARRRAVLWGVSRRAMLWGGIGAAAAVVATLVVVSRPLGPPPPAVSAPASSPAPPAGGAGFPWRIDRMASRLNSHVWSQEAAGSVEIWANLACPRSVTPYWIALRPEGEAVRFTCGSWQHHRWESARPGSHHFEVWKVDDGQALSGEGVLRSSTLIAEQTKAASPG
ncbi:helix-turn-helix domain-containing protein [Nonomuraea sp. NPDC050643]|uniref:helix-turn-helix domain-containing protein n=1 Tax=Nonomuraea sp. NPDC050643 TaxID=3155660 RepID=UPI0033E0ADF7